MTASLSSTPTTVTKFSQDVATDMFAEQKALQKIVSLHHEREVARKESEEIHRKNLLKSFCPQPFCK